MIKKYLPVWVDDYDNKYDIERVRCCDKDGGFIAYLRKGLILDSLPYSADELLEVLQKVKDMPCTEVKKLYGEEYYGELYKKCSASEIIEKYREYEKEPKVGQMWKSKYTDTYAYVTQCDDRRVYYVFRDGSCDSSAKDDFFNTFDSKVKDADETILAFLDKLKGGD